MIIPSSVSANEFLLLITIYMETIGYPKCFVLVVHNLARCAISKNIVEAYGFDYILL